MSRSPSARRRARRHRTPRAAEPRQLVGYRLPLGAVPAPASRTRRSPTTSPAQLGARARAAPRARTRRLAVPLVFRDWPLGVARGVRPRGRRAAVQRRRRAPARARSRRARRSPSPRRSGPPSGRCSRSIEASESERARWARELHDETLQDIGALRVLLTTARNRGDPRRGRRAVEDAIGRLGEMSGSLRSLISDLRPALLDQLGTGAGARGDGRSASRRARSMVDSTWTWLTQTGGAPTGWPAELELARLPRGPGGLDERHQALRRDRAEIGWSRTTRLVESRSATTAPGSTRARPTRASA